MTDSVEAAHVLTPVPIEQVKIHDAFWATKREIWRNVTVRDVLDKFEANWGDALANFDRVRDGRTGDHAGPPWTDGLVYETIMGAALLLRETPDPDLAERLEDLAKRIAAAAERDPDGYLNTYTQLQEPGHRWGLNGGFERWQHDFYNLGALVDAGVQLYLATGKTTLLNVGVKIANHMAATFGPAPKQALIPSHELPEEAMLRLAALVREQPDLRLSYPTDADAYQRLAEYWIEARGHHIDLPDWSGDQGAAERFVREYRDYDKGRPSWGAYAQDDKPVLEQNEIVGHAVRATLLCSALAAAAQANGRDDYRAAALRLWESMALRRMHITGGVGAFANDEKFGADFELPNDAYLETCAAVGAGFFHHNMNLLFGDARYADELERVLFNGILCGISLAGDTYAYQNPIESTTPRERWKWHDCPCCPPMFLKIMGAMPGYIYATDADSLYVNLYAGSEATAEVNGAAVKIRQTTEYPWEGRILLAIDPEQTGRFGLMVRIPAWSEEAKILVNGQPVDASVRSRGYVRIDREWQAGDRVELNLPMPVRALTPDPRVQATRGRTAIMRGPLVYCVESADHPTGIGGISLGDDPAFVTKSVEGLPGITAVEATDSSGRRFTTIPFYANANRGAASFAVWILRDRRL